MKDMSKMTRHATSCLPGPALKTICLCGLAVILAACKHGDDGARVAGWSLVDPSEAHPILVSQKPSTLSLEVSRGSYGLSPAQRPHHSAKPNASSAPFEFTPSEFCCQS